MSRKEPTKPVLALEWIVDRVSIDIQHPMVYANGRQQSKVIVYIEAKRDSQFVKLTATERASVHLIDYISPDNEIPFANDTSGESYKGWSAQHESRGYLFHPATLAQDEASPDEMTTAYGDYLEFFLTADAGAIGGTLSLAFVVTGDNGWRYRTDGYVFAPDGSVGPNELYDTGRDKNIRPEAPMRYGREQFRLEQRRHTDEAAIFNETVTLSIQDGRAIVPLRSMQCTPSGMIHWMDNLPSTQNPCYTGYAEPGDKEVHWNKAVPIGGQPRPTLAAAVPDKGVIMLCGRIDIPRRDHVDPPRGPIDATMIDAYGSDQTCSIGFVTGTRDELQVT